MNKQTSPTHRIAEPKVVRTLPMAELRSRKARKNVIKVTPITVRPAKTIG